MLKFYVKIDTQTTLTVCYCNVCTVVVVLEQDNMVEPYPEDLGQQFTEMFVKQTENVSLLLSLLQVL